MPGHMAHVVEQIVIPVVYIFIYSKRTNICFVGLQSRELFLMKHIQSSIFLVALIGVPLTAFTPRSALAADKSKVDAATHQVDVGGRMMGSGQFGDGVAETAKGIGNTVVEGAKYSGEEIKEGLEGFGRDVDNFFEKAFGSE